MAEPRVIARHEAPEIDDAALAAARAADLVLQAARAAQNERWIRFLEPLPDHLRDDDLADLRKSALRCRAAFGPKDSIRDVFRPDVTEPFLLAVDRLLRRIARRNLER